MDNQLQGPYRTDFIDLCRQYAEARHQKNLTSRLPDFLMRARILTIACFPQIEMVGKRRTVLNLSRGQLAHYQLKEQPSILGEAWFLLICRVLAVPADVSNYYRSGFSKPVATISGALDPWNKGKALVAYRWLQQQKSGTLLIIQNGLDKKYEFSASASLERIQASFLEIQENGGMVALPDYVLSAGDVFRR